MGIDRLNPLLEEFCKTAGLPELTPNKDNYYVFEVNDSLHVEIKYDTDSELVIFFVQLGLIHPDQQESLIPEILDANVLWRGTGGVTLGQDSATGMVTLAYQERIDGMSCQRFEEIFEIVISNAESWHARVSGESLSQDFEPKESDLIDEIRG